MCYKTHLGLIKGLPGRWYCVEDPGALPSYCRLAMGLGPTLKGADPHLRLKSSFYWDWLKWFQVEFELANQRAE